MKKIIFLLFTANCLAQAPSIEWQKSFGGANEERVCKVTQCADLGYIIIGSTSSNAGDFSTNHGGNDMLLIKTDADGNRQWQKLYGGSGSDIGKGVAQTLDGGYIITGYSNSSNGDTALNHGYQDAWIIKLNSSGIIEWQKSLGGSQPDYGIDIHQTIDGGYIMIGYSTSLDGDHIGNSVTGVWIVKLSLDGTIQWQKSLLNNYFGESERIRQTSDNGYIVGYYGSNQSTPSSLDIKIAKLDSQGAIQFQKNYGGTKQELFSDIEQTIDSGYIITGSSMSADGDVTGHHNTVADTNDIWIIKTNSAGTIQWEKSLGSIYHDFAASIQQTTDGNYIVLGSSGNATGDLTHNYGQSDIWVVKLNGSGTMLWQKSYGGSLQDVGYNIGITSDNKYYFLGTSTSNNFDVTQNFGGTDIWLVKLNSDQLSNQLFQQKDLILFPNPVNNILYINIAENLSIDKILIVDIAGKILTEQTSSNQINVGNLSNGMYFIKVFSGGNSYQTKFIKQ